MLISDRAGIRKELKGMLLLAAHGYDALSQLLLDGMMFDFWLCNDLTVETAILLLFEIGEVLPR